jgi:hypothetical protein
MYVFGVVVSDADETPIGRASVALKAELPSLFPEHGFEFLGPQDLREIGPAEANRLLFRVLASQVRDTEHEEMVSDLASSDPGLRQSDCSRGEGEEYQLTPSRFNANRSRIAVPFRISSPPRNVASFPRLVSRNVRFALPFQTATRRKTL